MTKHTTQSGQIAEWARDRLAAWAEGEPTQMKGWRTMSVSQLHDICDPNTAFIAVAQSLGYLEHVYARGPEKDILDEAMAEYDRRYATTTVTIPGRLYAEYSGGRITKFTFVPAGGDPGYFGPHAEIFEGPDIGDLKDQDAPFWKAVADALPDGRTIIHWEG